MRSDTEWAEILEKEGRRAVQEYGANAIDFVAKAWVRAIQADALEAAALECEKFQVTMTASGMEGKVPLPKVAPGFAAAIRNLKPEQGE